MLALVLVVEAVVWFSLGYAFRGFISRELVKAAADAKSYLAQIESDVKGEINKL